VSWDGICIRRRPIPEVGFPGRSGGGKSRVAEKAPGRAVLNLNIFAKICFSFTFRSFAPKPRKTFSDNLHRANWHS
jgi:hypothetical protein